MAHVSATRKNMVGLVPSRKKVVGISATQLTLRNLRKRGYLPAVVEKWNPHIKIRQDLFGFIDVLGVKRDCTIAVQCTSGGGSGNSNMSARLRKIADHKNIGFVREANWIIEVHGWTKIKGKWQVQIIDVS